jgi:Mn-containing catalase
VQLVFNMSQGEDVRGPWNQEPNFEYIADPKQQDCMPAPPVNPDDERPARAKAKVGSTRRR